MVETQHCVKSVTVPDATDPEFADFFNSDIPLQVCRKLATTVEQISGTRSESLDGEVTSAVIECHKQLLQSYRLSLLSTPSGLGSLPSLVSDEPDTSPIVSRSTEYMMPEAPSRSNQNLEDIPADGVLLRSYLGIDSCWVHPQVAEQTPDENNPLT